MFRTVLLMAMSLLLVACGCNRAWAAPAKYTFDKAHTQIIFNINHLGFSNSYGKFTDFDGHIMYDEAAPESGSVEVAIKTASIEMNDQAWNDHMKNEDFFNVEKFPEMTFKSTGIEITGDDTAKITGDLTILDVTKSVVLDVKHNKTGKHPFGDKYAAGFSATTQIKRSEFGMGYGLPNVADDVNIIIEVEAYREEEGGEGAGNK